MLKIVISIVSVIILAIIGLFVAKKYFDWSEIRQKVTNWLHDNNLAESAVMKVWVEVTLTMDTVVRTLKVKTVDNTEQVIEEISFRLKDIEDQAIINELKQRGYYQKDITELHA
jgi:hypothetical protein